jgi:FtsP/CotA-like multicopper oxidase with cupredoxin domain
MLVRDIDRRAVLRAGLAGGLAAAGAGVLAACDTTSTAPGSAYGRTPAAVAGGAEGGSLILPDNRLVAAAERARFATGRIRSHAVSLVPGTVDLGGLPVTTWSYDGMLPGPVIRVNKGDTVRATFTNKIAQPTSVHWHGVSLRNDMDGTLVTQQPIAPGASFTYQFKASDPGTYWYHPHTGTQLDRGLYGMLIVDDPAEAGNYDQEWLVVLDDWIDGVGGNTPDKVLALLKQGMGGMSSPSPSMDGMGGMGMGGSSSAGSMGSMGSMGAGTGSGVLLSGATSPLLGGDAGDVRYPYYLINGRVATAPHVFTGKPGQRVRLRILNAGGDTAFRVALGGHTMTVTHTDGQPVQPVRTQALLLGMAERYDVIVTLGDGVFPLVGYAEGKDATALAVVRTGSGSMPSAGAMPAELAGVLRGYGSLQPPASAAPNAAQPDVTSRLELTGNMSSYSWGFNGTTHPMGEGFIGPSFPRLVRVQQGKRLRITWVNTTKMWHPMHIHGHTFQVNGSGPLKDTVNVLPGQTVTCDFDTNNPGQWMAHCHNVYHEQAGMMGVIGYIT